MSESDRLLLKQIVGGEQRQNAPRATEEKYFEIFTAEQILKKRGFDLDPEQIRSGVIGAGGDGGVDSIYLFANKRLVREDADLSQFKGQQLTIELVIVQSKYQNSFSEMTIQKFSDFTENCLPVTAELSQLPKKLYNEPLLQAVNLFHDIYKMSILQRPKLAITFFYASLGEQIDPKVTLRSSKLEQTCREFYSAATVSFEFVGAKELLELFNRTPSKTLSLRTSKSIPWSLFGTAYICLVPLKNFYLFLNDNGNIRGHIFESNVRDYHGDSQVNQEIAATLLDDGDEEFWWLNNGITIIASKVVSSGDIFSVTDPLIVNGLQTSHEIYYHYWSAELGIHTINEDDKRTVLVRMIESTDPKSIDHIIKATNSQTKIPQIWLHATEEIHRKIELALKSVDLYYDRRKNFYRNQGKAASKIVTIPYLSQALAAIVLQRPDDARARPTTVADRHYDKMFSDKYPIGLYIKAVQLLKRVDEYLDGFGVERALKNNVMFHIAMYVSSVVLGVAHPTPAEIASLDMEAVSDDLLSKIIDIVGPLYDAEGGDDSVAKGSALVDRLLARLESEYPRLQGQKTLFD